MFIDHGDRELTGVIAAGALLLAATGPDPWSVGALLDTRRTRTRHSHTSPLTDTTADSRPSPNKQQSAPDYADAIS